MGRYFLSTITREYKELLFLFFHPLNFTGTLTLTVLCRCLYTLDTKALTPQTKHRTPSPVIYPLLGEQQDFLQIDICYSGAVHEVNKVAVAAAAAAAKQCIEWRRNV